MDEDFYDSDASVEESDEDVRPVYNGAIQPYMFEPTMTPEEVAGSVRCITQHPGFHSVASLCPYSLQAAYFGFRQEHGCLAEPSVNEYVIDVFIY